MPFRTPCELAAKTLAYSLCHKPFAHIPIFTLSLRYFPQAGEMYMLAQDYVQGEKLMHEVWHVDIALTIESPLATAGMRMR